MNVLLKISSFDFPLIIEKVKASHLKKKEAIL